MNRVYKVNINVYNTLKKRKPHQPVDTLTYTVIANDKDSAGGKAISKAWEQKRAEPEKYKGCVFGFSDETIKPIGCDAI